MYTYYKKDLGSFSEAFNVYINSIPYQLWVECAYHVYIFMCNIMYSVYARVYTLYIVYA